MLGIFCLPLYMEVGALAATEDSDVTGPEHAANVDASRGECAVSSSGQSPRLFLLWAM